MHSEAMGAFLYVKDDGQTVAIADFSNDKANPFVSMSRVLQLYKIWEITEEIKKAIQEKRFG